LNGIITKATVNVIYENVLTFPNWTALS